MSEWWTEFVDAGWRFWLYMTSGRVMAIVFGVAFAVLVVQMATPVAVTSYLIAEKYEADAETVAGMTAAAHAIRDAGVTLPMRIGRCCNYNFALAKG